MIVGVDLGVRSAHISMLTYDTSIVARRGQRREEIKEITERLCSLYTEEWHAYIEEPVVAGARNLRTSLQIAQIAGVIMARVASFTLVPVSSWKKEIIGRGNAKKEDVAEWLRTKRPDLYERTAGIQDRIDANCIRLYGERIAAGHP